MTLKKYLLFKKKERSRWRERKKLKKVAPIFTKSARASEESDGHGGEQLYYQARKGFPRRKGDRDGGFSKLAKRSARSSAV